MSPTFLQHLLDLADNMSKSSYDRLDDIRRAVEDEMHKQEQVPKQGWMMRLDPNRRNEL